jgi:NAD(P)-dependent dehydrogenase (short-subunit alcohol dehydrogenase family)
VGRATAISYAAAGSSKIAIGARSDFGTLESEIHEAAKKAGHPVPQILAVKLDVADNASVIQAAKLTEEAFGGLDILINNAGYLETFVPIADSDIDEYWRTWEINYRGVYWVTKAFLPVLFKLPKGEGLRTVVNLSSVGAHMTRPGASAYQTTKFALLRFTEFLTVEYEKEGLLSFAIHPVYFDFYYPLQMQYTRVD